MTYGTLVSSGQGVKDATGKKVKEGQKRLDQIVEWLGKDFDGVIAFDEAHFMVSAVEMKGSRGKTRPSRRALAGVDLQKRLPNARVVYASATAATEVANLGYATRLGLYGVGTPFASVEKFIYNVASGGVAAMEVVAKDMKAMGLYQARSLSYDDVSYAQVEHALTPEQRAMYDETAGAWRIVLDDVRAALGEDQTGQAKNGDAKGAAMAAFWGSQQRFFSQMLTSLQMPSVLKAVQADLDAGRAPVLQIVNTNEAATERVAARLAAEKRDLDDLDITPRQALMQYLQNSFPVAQFEAYADDEGKEHWRPVKDSMGNPVQNPEAVAARDALLDRVASIRFPDGPIEILLNHFGPEQVAEITGRSRRFVRVKDPASGLAKMTEQKRSEATLEKEAAEFQAGKRQILVFSDAGGTGLSYHADKTKRNQKKRVHYLLQPGWRADKAIQGLGRTHRTNQAQAPHVVLVTTDLRGHRRFVASIARRMDQLGALTRGQRQTGGQGLFTAEMNLESPLSARAIEVLIGDVMGGRVEGVDRPVFEAQMGLQIETEEGNRKASSLPTIQQFLNRILVLDVDLQTRVFDAFMERVDAQIEVARAAGTLDVGMENVTAKAVRKVSEEEVYTHPETGAKTRLVELDLTHSIDLWTLDQAMAELLARRTPVLFFARNRRSGRVYAFSKAPEATDSVGAVHAQYRRWGVQANHYALDRADAIGDPSRPTHRQTVEAAKRWEYLDVAAAAEAWADAYAKHPTEEHEQLHLLTGVLLPIWDRLTDLPAVQVRRALTDDGEMVLGRYVPKDLVDKVLSRLTGTSRAAKLTPAEVFRLVLEDGATVILANNWRLSRRLVSGERRIELSGPYDWAERKQLRGHGVISERIGYETRLFVPTGENGPEVMERVMLNRPAAEVMGDKEDDGGTRATIKEPVLAGYEVGGDERGSDSVQARRRRYAVPPEQTVIDLDAPPAVSGAARHDALKQQLADNFLVHYRAVPVGEVPSGVDRAETAQEAAHVFAPFRKHAQETMLALVTDADHRILSVIRHTKGLKDAASVDPPTLVAAIAATEGAVHVWFGHNHPSGTSLPSQSDLRITGRLAQALDGAGIEVRGHVIVGGTTMTVFEQGANQITRRVDSQAIKPLPRRRGKVQITERVLRRRPGGRQQVTSPEASFRIIDELGLDSGLLLLDNQHHVVGVLRMSDAEMGALRVGDRVRRVLRAIDATNASAAIIVSRTEYSGHGSPGPSMEGNGALNLARYLANLGAELRVLDVIHDTDNRPRSALGLDLRPDGVFFAIGERGQRSAPGDRLGAALIEGKLRGWLKGWTGLSGLEVRVVEREADLPEQVLAALARRRMRSPNAFAKAVFVPGRSGVEGELIFVAESFRSLRDALKTLLHEAGLHVGLRRMMGPGLDALLERVADAHAEGVARIAKRYSYDLERRDERLAAAEEYLADLAETHEDMGLLRQVYALVRRWLREMGIRLRLSDADIDYILSAARRTAQRGVGDEAAGMRRAYGGRAEGRGASGEGRFTLGEGEEDARLKALLAQYAEVRGAPSAQDLAEAVRQYREVEGRYAEVLRAHDQDGKPLPAPNGKPSNLSREQWLLVRTPNFRRWFGDWEIAANAPGRSAQTFAEANNLAQAFKNQDLRNAATGLIARVSGNSLDKMLNDKAVSKSETPAAHALAVANLDRLFERALLGWSKPDAGGDRRHYVAAAHEFRPG